MDSTSAIASKENGKTLPVVRWIREAIAIVIWTYVVFKLFVFDIDLYFINLINPKLIWIAEYKFFIILGALALIIVLTRNRPLITWTLYILFYPLILLLWKIPYILFRQKSWTLAFAFLNAVVSLFTSIKYKIVALAAFLIAQLVIMELSMKDALMVATGVLMLLTFVAYIRTFTLVFQPSKLFQVYSQFIKKSPKFVLSTITSDQAYRNLPVERLSESQLQTRRTNIQLLLIANRAVLFISRKLKAYQESRFNALSYIVSLFLLMVFTILSFAGVGLAQFKLAPLLFSIAHSPTYFSFLYYSFHTFLFSSIPEIMPVGLVSQATSMIEQVCAIALVFFLVSLYFTVRNERYKEELSNTVNETTKIGRELQRLIQDEYRMDIDEALEEVKKMNVNMMKVIVWLSEGLE